MLALVADEVEPSVTVRRFTGSGSDLLAIFDYERPVPRAQDVNTRSSAMTGFSMHASVSVADESAAREVRWRNTYRDCASAVPSGDRQNLQPAPEHRVVDRAVGCWCGRWALRPPCRSCFKLHRWGSVTCVTGSVC